VADREIYIGTVGPLLIDEDDDLASNDGQVMTFGIFEARSMLPASSVVTETAFGETPTTGTGTRYARDDHSHGTPANPVSGYTGNIVVGSQTLHFINGLLNTVT
jgi:hypothetical protein